jgi:hypothetical protein
MSPDLGQRVPTGSGGIATGGDGADVLGLVPGAELQAAAAYARKVLLDRHRSLLGRADVEARHAPAGRPPAARHEPSFSGDDLVLWQVPRTSPSSWRTIGYIGSDPWFPGGRGRFRTSGLCRVNESAHPHRTARNHASHSIGPARRLCYVRHPVVLW